MRSQDATERGQQNTDEESGAAGEKQDLFRAEQDASDERQVCFPFWMAREIGLDLLEKERLQAEMRLTSLELTGFKELTRGLEQQVAGKQRQLELLREQKFLLETRLKMEKARKPRNLRWWLRLVGAVGLGFLLGRM